jgi:hypothetical protein
MKQTPNARLAPLERSHKPDPERLLVLWSIADLESDEPARLKSTGGKHVWTRASGECADDFEKRAISEERRFARSVAIVSSEDWRL